MADDKLTAMIKALQALVKVYVPEVKYAPPTMTFSVSQFPFSYVIPEDGDMTLWSGEGWWKDVFTFSLDIHVANTLLQSAIDQAIPMRDKVAKMLMENPTLNGTVKAVVGAKWHFGVLEYTNTIGWRFSITVKQET